MLSIQKVTRPQEAEIDDAPIKNFQVEKDKLKRSGFDESKQPIAVLYGDTPRDGMCICLDATLPGDTPTKPVEIDGSKEKVAIEPTHNPIGRDVFAVGGKSGSGKSNFAKNFATRYHCLWPERKIILVSYLKKDRTLDALPFITRVKGETFLGDVPSLRRFDKTLLLFDDIEAYGADGAKPEEKEIHKAIMRVINMIATTGRHNASTILFLTHALTDYKKTRLFLGECHGYVVFPSGVCLKQLNNLLGGYAGADKEDIMKIRYELPTRWVALKPNFPPVVVHERGAYMLRTYGKKAMKRCRDAAPPGVGKRQKKEEAAENKEEEEEESESEGEESESEGEESESESEEEGENQVVGERREEAKEEEEESESEGSESESVSSSSVSSSSSDSESSSDEEV